MESPYKTQRPIGIWTLKNSNPSYNRQPTLDWIVFAAVLWSPMSELIGFITRSGRNFVFLLPRPQL